jgi:UDP-N-acetylglucosamine acyltransferase
MIHPTAIIEDGAELGTEVSIGAFSYISKQVKIGNKVRIGPRVTILPYCTIGEACEIHNGVVLSDLPQDLSFSNQPSYLEIGKECIIREYVTIHRGTKPESKTQIGDRCLLMAQSHIAHNVVLEDQVILANSALLGGYVRVGMKAFVSAHCLIHQFVQIGRLAMLGGGSAYSKDVPPFCLGATMQLNQILGLNVVGLRRAGFDPATRAELKALYAHVYRSTQLDYRRAAESILKNFSSPEAQEFAHFILNSKRGICGTSSSRKFFSETEGAEGAGEE